MIILTHLSVRDFKSLREIDLAFPRRASILVEGFNEAGKSTLFESVYFALYGEPLVAEETTARGRGRFDSVINYQADMAMVVLTLDVDGTTLVVERVLRRGRSSNAYLRIIYPDGTDEGITTVRAVNERLVQELGNLDKDTLLNSCFVEQKKLSKLEDLGGPARRDSLERLLNLDKLQILQEEMRVTSQDRVAVQLAQERLLLAGTQAEIPVIEGQIATLQRQLTAVELHKALDSIAEQEQLQAQLTKRQLDVDARREQLNALQTRIAGTKQAADEIRTLVTARHDLDRLEHQIIELKNTLDELNQRERTDLPNLNARLAAFNTLSDTLDRLQQQADKLKDMRAASATLEQQLAEIDRRSAYVQNLAHEIADTAAELDLLEMTINTDEQHAQHRIIELTARQEALQNVIRLLEQRVELEHEQELAAQTVAAAREQVAAYEKLRAQIDEIAQTQARLQEELIAAEATYTAAYTYAQQAEAVEREADGLERWIQGQRDLAAMNEGEAKSIEIRQRVLSETQEYETRRQTAQGALTQLVMITLLAFIGLGIGLAILILGGQLWGSAFVGISILLLTLTALMVRRWLGTREAVRAAQTALDDARQTRTEHAAKQAALEALGGGHARIGEAEKILRSLNIGVPSDMETANTRLSALRTPDAVEVSAAREHAERMRSARDDVRERLQEASTRLSMLHEQATQHPGAQPATIQQAGADNPPAELTARQREIEQQLTDQATACSVTPERESVHTALNSVSQKLEQQRSIVAAIPARRETLATRRKQLAAQQSMLHDERAWLEAHPRTTVEQDLAKQNAVITQYQRSYLAQGEEAKRAADELEITPEAMVVHQARGATMAMKQQLENELARRPALTAKRVGLSNQVAKERERLHTCWQRCLPLPEGIDAPTTALPSADELALLEDALSAALLNLDEPHVQQQYRELANEQGTITAQQTAANDTITCFRGQVTQLLAGQHLTAAPTRDAIAEVFPVMREVTRADGERLTAALEELKATLGATRLRRDQLAADLGLQHVTLDEAACAADLEARQKELQVKTQAERIIKGVRERIVQKVLPNTERNMCLLLPLLTADRYRDCVITTDYKLQVWDEGAGRYVAKNVFSGGTRDQLSLVLRLAFALATLPEELGTTPGFIFLDEPLSSFDRPRTEALIRLLTQGQVAANFSQIFVISHNRMFDHNAFTHHLLMDGGCVVEHDFDRVALPEHAMSPARA